MTRNFSNRRRENTGPSSRNTSSGRYREDQSFRSARPRLSRDAVDRGWENGASHAHADYRPRQSTNRPPSQRPRQSSPAFERSRQPYNHRSSETRQQSYGSPSSSFNRNGYQPRREQPPRTGPRRFNEPGRRAPGGRPSLNSERWTRESGARSEDSTTRYQGRDRYQERGPSHFDQRRSGAPERQNYRGEYRPRTFERSHREGENFARGRRPNDPRTQRDNYNPRWQSRPTAQRGHSESRRQYPDGQPERPPFWQRQAIDQPESEQFEGDYEQFDTYEQVEHQEQPPQPYEKHVTRLPDGRVLKGSRPQQREQARFWTDVEEEAGELMPPIPAVPKKRKPEKTAARPARLTKQPEGSKVRKIKTVKTARARDGAPKANKAKTGTKKASGTPGPATRPFQRGYKWPTAGE